MKIHKFEKIWIAASLLLIVGFIATITYGSVGIGIEMVDAEGGQVDPQHLDGTRFADPGVEQTGQDEYDVTIVARQFLYQPGTAEPITVPAESTVTFYITSGDVIHGFNIVGTNMNTMVIPGQVTKLTVEFDEPAEYGIVCNEYCGAGHHAMEGKLVVVPQAEYEGA